MTSCTNGSLSLARFDCSTWPCGDTPSESVFLRWNEQEVTVRMHHEGTPIPRSPTGQPQLELMERPISPALLPGLLAEFAVLPRSPADPAWLPDVRLRDIFEVVGECDDSWLSADLAARRLNLVATLKSAPAGDAPQVLMLWVRGPGPRAERLFSRLEKLTRVDR